MDLQALILGPHYFRGADMRLLPASLPQSGVQITPFFEIEGYHLTTSHLFRLHRLSVNPIEARALGDGR